MRLHLPAMLTASTLSTELPRLKEAAATSEPLEIDASGLQSLDTAGAQLLALLVRDRRQAGRNLGWKGANVVRGLLGAALPEEMLSLSSEVVS